MSIIFVLFSLSLCLCVHSIDVKTSSGTVRGKTYGVLGKSINEFLNIPFAEPPVGKLRFSPPIPVKEAKKDLIDGTKTGKTCLQYSNQNPVSNSEDCLILNVYSSNTKTLKPVMFWIYGGGFRGGSSSGYDGSTIATHDVVVVTVNYRLGPFGFLYAGDESAPGNVGLYDQTLALKWVKQNIHAFGGDPNQITIFGESAGSYSVSAHILSPLSRGLFKRAILQSGAIYDNKETPILPKHLALIQAQQMAKHFNCTDSKVSQWLDCLRKVDARAIASYGVISPYAIHQTEFLPFTAQNAFKSHNYSTEIDIMAGVMQNEGSSLAHLSYPQCEHLKSADEFRTFIKRINFPHLDYQSIGDFYLKVIDTNSTEALKKAFYDFYGDIHIACPCYSFAKAFSEHTPKRNAFFYEWTYLSDMMRGGCKKDMGICHGSEIGYVFGSPVRHNMADKSFSEDVMKMWTNFAKNGNPMEGFPSDYHWPRMTTAGVTNSVTKTKDISYLKPNHIFDNQFAKTCDGFWKNYFN